MAWSREMGVELERVVVMAEDEQVWEPSSDGQGSVVGVAKASVRSRLTLCRATGFGIRSLGPGAEKDSEKWGCKIPCQGGAVTPSPESRGSRAHEPQGEKLGCAPRGLWSAQEAQAAGLCWGPWEAALGSNDRSHCEPQAAGRK